MAPIEPEAMRAAVTGSPLFAKYGTAVDRESAFEKLTAAQAPPAEPAAAAPEPESAPGREKAGQAERAGKAGKSRSVVEQVMGNSAVKSMLRSVGGQIGREITRGLFGTARRKR